MGSKKSSLCELVPLLAFGYHAAALRGEAPPVVTPHNVEAWLETRPAYARAAARFQSPVRLAEWKEKVVRLVVEQLERTAVR